MKDQTNFKFKIQQYNIIPKPQRLITHMNKKISPLIYGRGEGGGDKDLGRYIYFLWEIMAEDRN
jgi:hypothetical protein